jgi:predicted xylose isomerase-like sugar epimerase
VGAWGKRGAKLVICPLPTGFWEKSWVKREENMNTLGSVKRVLNGLSISL